jgi:two-component system response regulator
MERMPTILLVEDDPDDVELIRLALEEQRVRNDVVVVRDGAEAIEYLFCEGRYASRCIRERPQLVLLDLKLPKVSGLEVLQRIRSDPRTHNLPVVIFTSSREERDLIEGYRLGANSYVQKPVGIEEFSAAVRQLDLYWVVLNQPAPADEAHGGAS